jgi:VanZ family protein
MSVEPSPSSLRAATGPTPSPSPLPKGRTSASAGFLALYTLAIVYASLSPFFGWRWPVAITLFDWPKYITLFDSFINVAAYIPLGALLAMHMRRRALRAHRTHPHLHAWGVAVLASAGLSFLLEAAQSMLPQRVSSPVDVLNNTIGAMQGALFVLLGGGRRVLAAIEHWRLRHFSHESHTDWALLLIALWLLAQLNPAIPFFSSGFLPLAEVEHAEASSYELWQIMPQVLGIALNTLAFSLLVSICLHPTKRVLLNVGLVMTLGLIAKLVMASLLLKTPQLSSTLSPSTVMGVTAGILAFVYFSGLRYRWRAFVATLAIFAGSVFSKMSGVYGALDDTLKLFQWPHGQLANFTSLTSWINEVWPLAALIYLAIAFLRERRYGQPAPAVRPTPP